MYRIKVRKYSSNVIERGIKTGDHTKWSVYICPTVKKVEGDALCEFLLETLK